MTILMVVPSGDDTGRTGTRATLGGFVAILLWSTTVAMARSLSEQLGPVTAAAAVYVVSGILSLARLVNNDVSRQQIWRLPRRYLIGCGLLFVSYMLFLFLAIGLAQDRQQVLEVGLLNYLWPVLTVLLSVALLGCKANLMLLPGAAFALLGTFLVLTHGTNLSWRSVAQNVASSPLAYGLGLAAAVLWAFYSVLTRKWAADQLKGATDIFLPATAIALILTCFSVAEPRSWGIRPITEAIFLGLATYFAYSLWDAAMRRGNVLLVAVGSYMTPLLSTIVSCLYLAVMPGPSLWLGCGLLIVGSLLSWRSVAERV